MALQQTPWDETAGVRIAEIGSAEDHIAAAGLTGKSLLSITDLTREQMATTLALTDTLAMAHRAKQPVRFAYPKSVAMIFEKPSLRTRCTFEIGIQQLGGHPVVLGPAEIGLGTRESVPDAARNLERWVDGIMARVFDHKTLIGLRDHSRVPIINGLSDVEHPCQILADLYTLQQKWGSLAGRKLTWVGDGNNVLHSLLLAAALTDLSLHAACPEGYLPNPQIVRQAQAMAQNGTEIVVGTDPATVVQGADAVYTDVWTSMGQEAEKAERLRVLAPYQVNAALMAQAKPNALFLHCLPAHRGEEVTDEVLDGAQSVVFDQAENRLHAQKAALVLLMGLA